MQTHRLWEAPDGTLYRVHLVELGQEASASHVPLRGVEFVPLGPRPTSRSRFVVPEWEAVLLVDLSDSLLTRMLQSRAEGPERRRSVPS